MIYIDGIGISGYRGFGPDVVRIGPFRKLNLFIGKNNLGKSTVLHFIKHKHPKPIENILPKLAGDDVHHGLPDGDYAVDLALKIGESTFEKILQRFPEAAKTASGEFKNIVVTFLRQSGIVDEEQTAWFSYAPNGTGIYAPKWLNDIYAKKGTLDFARLYELLHPTSQAGAPEVKFKAKIEQLLDDLAPHNIHFFNNWSAEFIPAVRKAGMGRKDPTFKYSYDGEGLANELMYLKQPTTDHANQRAKFDQVEKCVRIILDDKNIVIEPETDSSDIRMRWGKNNWVPLANVGTGVHEVLILAMAATMIENSVVCIEEPELHAHPELQKRLLRYLAVYTNNQYFISTHSAHLLDTPDAAIFHVTMEDGCIAVNNVTYDKEKADVCADLGYRPSDLLQANCIIWVEGPSDRIYLNHWIKAKAEELIEGLHYSIMFYGGNLRAHLTAKDTDDDGYIGRFISLCRLNRNMIILIDSDKKDEDDSIKKTAKRLRDEFNDEKGLAWVTAGREIENYIKGAEIETAVKSVHENVKKLTGKGRYKDQTHYKINADTEKRTIDKVDIAREIAKLEVDWTVLDLKDRVEEVVEFIRNANGPEYSLNKNIAANSIEA